MKWLVSVPVWGEEHTAAWNERGWPALLSAVQGHDVRQLREVAEPPGANSSCKVGNTIRNAIEYAEVGDAVMTIHAEMVVPPNLFAVCEKYLDGQRKKLVVCPSMRVGNFMEDCRWGSGHCAIPPYVLFENSDGFVMHAFELHPIALVKGYGMEYTGPTPSEVISMFSTDEIAIVSPAEMWLREHPIGLQWDRLPRPFDHRDVERAAREFFFLKNQHWLFRQQIVIRGRHDPTAQRIADSIIRGWTWRDDIPEPVRRVKRAVMG